MSRSLREKKQFSLKKPVGLVRKVAIILVSCESVSLPARFLMEVSLNAEETYFSSILIKRSAVGFAGKDNVMYVENLPVGGELTMILLGSWGGDWKIENPLLIFKNKLLSYPIRGVLDIISRSFGRTAPKVSLLFRLQRQNG